MPGGLQYKTTWDGKVPTLAVLYELQRQLSGRLQDTIDRSNNTSANWHWPEWGWVPAAVALVARGLQEAKNAIEELCPELSCAMI